MFLFFSTIKPRFFPLIKPSSYGGRYPPMETHYDCRAKARRAVHAVAIEVLVRHLGRLWFDKNIVETMEGSTFKVVYRWN